MADIECKYRTSEYTLNTFDDVLKNVNWIRDAMRAVFQNYGNLSSHCFISFDSGDLSYECKSVDEFKKYAFGKAINVKTLSMGISEDWITRLITVYAHKQKTVTEQEYILSSADEKLLVDLRDALQAKKKGLPLASAPTIINCEKHEDNSIHIGSNNTISGSIIGNDNDGDNTKNTIPEEVKSEKWYSKILWKLVVPVVVIVLGAAVCLWLGLNN